MLNAITLFRVIFRRLNSTKGLALSTILGIISILGLAIAIPLFSRSVNAQLLIDELAALSAKTGRPLFGLHIYLLNYQDDTLSVENVFQISNYLGQQAQQLIGLPVKDVITLMRSSDMNLYEISPGTYSSDQRNLNSLRFDAVPDIEKHIRLVEGSWPDALVSPDGKLLGVLHQSLALKMGLHAGEEYFCQEGPRGQPIPFQISGIWTAQDDRDPFWFSSPRLEFEGSILLPTQAYIKALVPLLSDRVGFAAYYVIMDDSVAQWQDAAQYVQGIKKLLNNLQRTIPTIRMDYSPMGPLEGYLERASSLQVTLIAITAPLMALLLAYMVLMAEISVRRQRQEIATLRSRGTGELQIALMSIVETLLLSLLALPAAAGLAWLAALAMGNIRSFLQFSFRTSLPIAFERSDWRVISVAWAAIALARLIPTLGAAQHTIVSMKREQARPLTKPWWQSAYLDILSIIPAAYGYYVLYRRSGPLVPKWSPGEDPFREPLLFLAPSFFAFSACLITVRLFPILLGFLSTKRIAQWYPFTTYLSLTHLARHPAANSGPLLLVMLAMALSSYFASVAVTLDAWLVQKTRYQVGADLVVNEHPPAELISGGGSNVSAEDIEELELAIRLMPVSDHLRFPGIQHATRVGKYVGTFNAGGKDRPCIIMAIDRLDFPMVAFFREDFASESLGALMNALAKTEQAVLVPRRVFQEHALGLGDYLAAAVRQYPGLQIPLQVVGVYDYFPTSYPTEPPALIVNFDYLSMQLQTVPPFDIWFDLTAKPDTPLIIKDIEDTLDVDVSVQGDALEKVEEEENKSERVGVFGALTIGFLAAGLTSGLGFVLYSYASLRERFIQLGTLRAIGVSILQMIGHVGLEQLLLMGFALISGTCIGLLTSYLFIPFLQVGFQKGAVVPPFQVLVGWWQTIQISAGFGLVLLIALVATIWYLLRLKMFEAIKLGDVG